MIKIAIVDDEKIMCHELYEMLNKFEHKHKIVFDIKTFNSGEALLADIDSNSPYDLILLDIELAEINGIDVGCQIRNVQNDQTCQIIYISSKIGYAMELFQVRPFNFLIKPVDEQQLFSCIEEYIKLFSNEIYFEYVNKRTRKLIPVRDILYFESCGRKIILHCTGNQTYEYYGKMQELLENKCLSKFIMIHKSFFINLFHVVSYDYSELQMSDSQILSISKPNRAGVRRKMLEERADNFKES
jgi:DNA-binding LytR/AlgR family response regulator